MEFEFLVIFFSFPLLASSIRFRCDYTYVDQANGWFKLHPEPKTRSQANNICQKEGARIASAVFADFLLMMIYNNEHDVIAVHADLHDIDEQGQMEEWVSETAFIIHRNGSILETGHSDAFPFVCYKMASDDAELNECGTLDRDYALDNRTDYCYKFHRVRDTWFGAMATCATEEGHLAIINSEMEAQVIRDLFAANPSSTIPGNYWQDSAFLGFRSLDHGRSWITILDQTLIQAGYDKFAPAEPNNARRDEFCGSVGRNGLLYDDPCTRELPFICEKKTTRYCEVPTAESEKKLNKIKNERKHKYAFQPRFSNEVIDKE